MYDSEKNDVKSMSFDQKKQIAETCQLQQADVMDMLHKYNQME
jgi:hypothetical protein